MASTNFVNGTVVQADWLNDVDDLTYNIGTSTGAAMVGANAYQTQAQVNAERVTVTAAGAKGDGVTNDLAAILLAFYASRRVVFPAGVYNLGDCTDGQTLIDLSSYGQGVTIETEGRVELLVNMTTVGLANIFRLVRNSDFKCGPICFRDTGYSNLSSPLRGVRAFMIEGGNTVSWSNITIDAIHATNIIAPVYVTGGDASIRVRGINIPLIVADDCYYTYTSANNGDGVRIGQIISDQVYRSYFAYGCEDHEVKILNRRNRQTSGSVNVSRSPAGLNTSGIKIQYTAREQTRDINHVLVNHIDLLGGEIKDIDIDINIESSSIYTPVAFINYTGSGGTETAAASLNKVGDIRITGTCDVRARAIPCTASYSVVGNLKVEAGASITLGADLFTKFSVFANVKDSFYTPSWTSTGTAPNIGNGSLFGRYSIAGNLCHATLNLTGGSTTTWGTGQYSFSLPYTAKATAVGSFYVLDAGTTFFAGSVLVNSGTNVVTLYLTGFGGGVGAAIPMTWAVNDQLGATIVYPVA